ncbi:sensor histidine kinase [Caryophanon latum]|uniref:histidine kinase n=1 Tax=Caryophanon latum TaxID=33977 RepID=A0A1C0YSY9_9BACL|nr:sensor histidine kinase [Caryophanon latum]OCS90277.1 hypothetical protein A6K76_11760 [Caryophanon latum]
MRIKHFVHLFITFVVLVALCVIIERGPVYIGKTYGQSSQLQNEAHTVAQTIAAHVIQPLTKEHFNDYLTVTAKDVEAYRHYYGTLSEQLTKIEAEYAQKQQSVNEDVARALEQERAEKIADIERVFTDDAYVRTKVLALKEQVVQKIVIEEAKKQQNNLSSFTYYSYDLYDSKTMREAAFGNIHDDAIFTHHIEEGDLQNVRRTFLIGSYDVPALQPISYTVERSLQHVWGTMTIAKRANVSYVSEYSIFVMMQYVVYSMMAMAVIGALYAWRVRRNVRKVLCCNNPFVTYTASVPIDMFALFIIGAIYIVWAFIYSLSYTPGMFVIDIVQERISIYEWTKQLTWATIIFVMFIIVLYVAFAFVMRVKTLSWQQLWRQTVLYKGIDIVRIAFQKRSIGTKIVLWMVAFSGASFLVGEFRGVYSATEAVIVLTVIVVLLFFMMLHRVGQLTTIMSYTADVVNGQTPKAISITGNHPLAHHSEHVQTLREGMRDSLLEQQKSERLKTELITNVSHDLRTPLTAIMTYTELLKQPHIDEVERQKYVTIVDAKASRLKVLIDDLFEVSKMASGDVEMQKSKVDVAQLVQQAIGEHEEAFKAAQLDVRVTIAQQPIEAYIDGQKWWRMFDNLLVNAYKYSLPNTRVYIHLRLEDDEIYLSVKNVANYALNEDATELVERFKRADTARHTEGSGLGLAIAASIVNLHQGDMTIDVDGDLFKVVVRMPRTV